MIERRDVQRLSSKVAWLASLTDVDGYDPYGSAMKVAFDAAAILYDRDDMIPDEWEYRPGLNPMADVESDLVGRPSDYVRLAGNVAVELADVCRELGLDY